MQFKSVLITTDFSKTSMAALEFVAKKAKATKIIIYTATEDWTRSSFYARQTMHLELYKQARADMLAQAQKELEKLAKKYFKNKKVTCIAGLSRDNVAKDIIKEAKKQKVEAVIMASHGRSKLGSMVLGSVAQRVISLANMPVLMVPTKGKKE